MIITCPSCETQFNLPDEVIRKGAQLRCSVCKHVFGLPDTGGRMPGQTPDAAPAAQAAQPARPSQDFAAAGLQNGGDGGSGFEPEKISASDDAGLSLGGGSAGPEPRKRRRGGGRLLAGLVALLLLACGGAASWVFFGDAIRAHLPFGLGESGTVPEKDMISQIRFRGVRQYTLSNEKIGSIIVIEGKAVNGFTEPRELIRIEASLFDKDGKPLDKKQQMGGTSVSLFQLQVLGEKELEQALGNRIEILSNNTNVPPGGEVPFMIVFYKAPEAVAEFGVTVIEARMPPKK